MSIYFISDLHLSSPDSLSYSGFCDFLNGQASDATSLYILGDFFDAWIGDDDDALFFKDVKKTLKDYASKVPTYFMVGNRDFLVGERFARDTGVTLLTDEHVIDLYGEPTLLMHGDTLCTDDIEYQKFRAMVRNEQWQNQITGLPLAQRRQMAVELRSKSQSLNAMKAEDIMDVNAAEVERVMTQHNVKRLIHGHTHRPNKHILSLPDGSQAERIVLGDWTITGWFVKVDSALPAEAGQARAEIDLVEFTLAPVSA